MPHIIQVCRKHTNIVCQNNLHSAYLWVFRNTFCFSTPFANFREIMPPVCLSLFLSTCQKTFSECLNVFRHYFNISVPGMFLKNYILYYGTYTTSPSFYNPVYISFSIGHLSSPPSFNYLTILYVISETF